MDAAILAFIPMMFKEDDKARGFDFIYSKIDGLVEAAEEILRLKMKRQATLSVCVSDGGGLHPDQLTRFDEGQALELDLDSLRKSCAATRSESI